MTNLKLKQCLSSPLGVMCLIASLLLTTSFTIMVLMETVIKPVYGSHLSEFSWDFLAAVILIIVVTPFIYFLAVERLEKQQKMLGEQFNELNITSVTFNSREGVVVTDANNRILKVNRSFTDITGYSNEEVIGNTPSMLRSGRHDKSFYQNMWSILQRDGFWSGEVWNRNKWGKIYPEWLNITAVRDGDGNVSNYVGIFSDISEIKAGEEQLRMLTGHIQTVREEEKVRIAREIHDDLGGTLTSLKMETYQLAEKLAENGPTRPLLEDVKSMTQLLDQAVGVTRRVISDLHPTIIDDLGLVAALEWQCTQFSKRTGIICEVFHDKGSEEDRNLDKIRAINLFRIFQEALTNVSQHSGATRVSVEFFQTDDEVTLMISDNGQGLPENHAIASTSYGMRGMRERVAQLNGEINFDRPSSGGLRVTVQLPLDKDEEDK